MIVATETPHGPEPAVAFRNLAACFWLCAPIRPYTGFLRLALSRRPPPPSRHSTPPSHLSRSLIELCVYLHLIQIQGHLHIAPRRPGQLPQLYSTELNEEHRPTLREENAKKGCFSGFLKTQRGDVRSRKDAPTDPGFSGLEAGADAATWLFSVKKRSIFSPMNIVSLS